MPCAFSDSNAKSLPLYLVDQADAAAFAENQPPAVQAWLKTANFTGALGQTVVIGGADGRAALAVAGMGTDQTRKRGRFHLAQVAAVLPEGDWHLVGDMTPDAASEAALGWLLGGYRFDRYKAVKPQLARLKAPKGVDAVNQVDVQLTHVHRKPAHAVNQGGVG